MVMITLRNALRTRVRRLLPQDWFCFLPNLAVYIVVIVCVKGRRYLIMIAYETALS